MRARGRGPGRQTTTTTTTTTTRAGKARSKSTAVRTRAARGAPAGGRDQPRSAAPAVETRVFATPLENESGSVIDDAVKYVKTRRREYDEAGTPFEDETFVPGPNSKAKLPRNLGVTTPSSEPNTPKRLGWTSKAERWNSRAAMGGFVLILLIEGVSGRGILELFGVSIGNGLDIGF